MAGQVCGRLVQERYSGMEMLVLHPGFRFVFCHFTEFVVISVSAVVRTRARSSMPLLVVDVICWFATNVQSCVGVAVTQSDWPEARCVRARLVTTFRSARLALRPPSGSPAFLNFAASKVSSTLSPRTFHHHFHPLPPTSPPPRSLSLPCPFNDTSASALGHSDHSTQLTFGLQPCGVNNL